MSTFVCLFDSINTSELTLSSLSPRSIMQRQSGLHGMELPPPIPLSQESGSPEREPEEEVIHSIEDTLNNVRDDINRDTSLGRLPDAQAKELFNNAAAHIHAGTPSFERPSCSKITHTRSFESK